MLFQRLKNNGIPELKLNKLQLEMKAQVENKIKKGLYRFEQIGECPVCNNSHFKKIGEKDRYGLYFPVTVCTDCGFLITNPRMNQDSYNQFYNFEYRKLYEGLQQATKEVFYGQRKKGKIIYDFLNLHKLIDNKPKFILEIGCGAGGIIQYFKERGHQVKGIDLGEEYINFGRKFGLDLEATTLDNILINQLPDIIICSHIIEHFLDIPKELKLIKQFCHQDTIVYVEVPGLKQIHKNYEMNVLKYFQNAHTYHFTLTSLKNIFKKNGFTFLIGNEFVRSAFKLGNKNDSFEGDYYETIKYLKKQEKYRIFYIFSPHAIKKYFMKQIAVFLDYFGIRKQLKMWVSSLLKKK